MADHDLSDRYRHPRELDRRAEGVWYSAALLDGTAVRVLVLAPELRASVRHPERFFDALERAGRLTHPTFDVPRAWGQLASGDLHAAFPDSGSMPLAPGLPAAEVAIAGEEIARALGPVHQTGLAHGAISRGRLCRRPDGRLELREVGLLAALISGGVEPRAAALALSETHYVSPEVQNGSVPDDRSDIYSLGAVLYEVLTGKPPYGGRTTAYLMASVLAEEEEATPTVETTNPVVDALVRAIEREPDDRWSSAAAFADAIAAGATRGSASLAAPAKGAGRGCLPALVILAAAMAATMAALP